MKKDKTVSIIILNYNEKEQVKELVKSIKESTLEDYEVMICDNASKDDSAKYFQKNFPDVKLFVNENVGTSGYNKAIPYVKGRYVLTLHAHMRLTKDCLEKLVRFAEQNGGCAVAAKILENSKMYYNGTWLSRSFYGNRVTTETKENDYKEIPYFFHALIPEELIKKIEYIADPDYFLYAEDVDLGMRIRLAGSKIIYCPEAVMIHKTPKKSVNGKLNITFIAERNMLITFFKTLSARNILLFLPYVYGARFVGVFRDLLILKWHKAFSKLGAVLWSVANFGLILEKRKGNQKIRRVSDDYVLKVFSERNLFRMSN